MRSIRFLLPSLAAAALAAGCASSPRAAVSTSVTQVTRVTRATRVATVEGFRTPESVLYDPAQDVWYVSNINGQPLDHDGNGYISRLASDGTVRDSMFIAGGRNGVALDAPKGMAITGDTLWVADIDKVRAFSKTTGQPLFTVDFTALNATFLNDVAVAPDGNIYITDTSILFNPDGSTSHPAVDKIFVIRNVSRRMGTVADQGDRFGRPNGIAWDATHSRFLVVSFGAPTVLSWTPGALKPPTTVATGAGQFDGVVALPDGRALVSSWADSSVSVLDGSSLTRLISDVPAPADIGLDAQHMRLGIPLFTSGKVEFWQLQ